MWLGAMVINTKKKVNLLRCVPRTSVFYDAIFPESHPSLHFRPPLP